MNTAAIFKNGGCECRSRSRSKIFKIPTPIYVYIEKVSVKHPSKYLVLKIYKQFDFTAAILLNGGCEGQIKVRCEMFYTFEIAIHLSIH